jgi:purine-binding chemotaxis protein CheW
MQIEEILIIKNGSESYGISTEDINQISRVPSLMPLPLRPYGTRGLCRVGGNIVTMVDINLLLDMPSVDLENSDTRLITLNGVHSSNAILVSEVYNTVNIDENNIEYLNKDDDPIIAIYKYNNSLVQIISLDILFSKINRVEIESKEVQNGKVKAVELQEEDSTRFLIFAMEDEKFALSIEYLREIILADISYTEIAGSPDDMLGLITLRDELVSVVDLRSHYGFKSTYSDKNRILITSINDEIIGLLVDEIIDIKNYVNKDVEYIKDTFDNSKISGVIHDTESLISFFDKDVLEKLFEENRAYINSNSDIEEDKQTQESVMETIVFKLSDKEYAFEVDLVSEIIDIVSSTNVAYSEDGIDGIINIRGQIVTMVSLAQRLNINMKITEDSKIVVCNIDGSKIGFVVDSISDILSIKADEIKVQEDDDLFTNILHLDNGNRLVLSIDIQKIVSNKGI